MLMLRLCDTMWMTWESMVEVAGVYDESSDELRVLRRTIENDIVGARVLPELAVAHVSCPQSRYTVEGGFHGSI